MWTLALRGDARVAVVAAVAVEWCDVFDVVTRGRVQLELRNGKPRPFHGKGAHRHAHGHDRHLPVPVRQLPNDGGTT